jgi:glyoxylase-like metal-dependent hydrolase (beta-lactamase superfamily II)
MAVTSGRARRADGVGVASCRQDGPGGIVKAFVIRHADDVVIIDSGYSEADAAQIESALDSVHASMKDVKACLVTHFHRDHVGGLAQLRSMGAFAVLAHPADAERIEKGSGTHVDSLIADDEVIALCGGLHAKHVPGHSPGSIAIYYPAGRALFAGDAVLSAGGHLVPSPGYLSSDPEQAVESARALARLPWPVDHVFVGHGEEVYGEGQKRLARLLHDRRDV